MNPSLFVNSVNIHDFHSFPKSTSHEVDLQTFPQRVSNLVLALLIESQALRLQPEPTIF